ARPGGSGSSESAETETADRTSAAASAVPRHLIPCLRLVKSVGAGMRDDGSPPRRPATGTWVSGQPISSFRAGRGRMTSVSSPNPETKLHWWRNEDWLAVGVAAVVIILALLGVRPAMPAFRWESAGDLAGVLGAGNLASTLLLAGAMLALSIV